jgi:hypothetical protein
MTTPSNLPCPECAGPTREYVTEVGSCLVCLTGPPSCSHPLWIPLLELVDRPAEEP